MAETIVVLSGEDSKLLQAFNRSIQKEQEMANGFRGVEGASRKATDSSVADANRQEREWKKAADAMYREHKKLLDAKASESRKAGQAEEALARKVAFAEVNAAISAADQKIKQAEKTLKAKQTLAAEEMKTTDGPLASLQNTVTVAGAIATAVGLATKAWELYKTAQDSALATASGNADSTRRLTQVAKSPEDLATMQREADDASLQSGVSRDVAREVRFSARSDGFESDYAGVMAAHNVIDPKSAAVVAGKIPKLFEKGKVQIQPMAAVNMALRGAEESNLTFEQLSSSLPTAAEGGGLVGASPAELIATQSVLASRFKSGDTSAERIKAFGSSAGIDPRFKGKGIIGAYKAIRDLPEEERTDYLGKNQELNATYQILGEELPQIEARTLTLEAEQKDFDAGHGVLRNKMEIANSDKTVMANTNVNKAKRLEEITREDNLVQTAAVDFQAKSNANALIEKKGAGLLNRLATTSASAVLDYAPGTSPEFRANAASRFGDNAYALGQMAFVSPIAGLGTAAVDRVLGTDKTAVASRDIQTRQERAQSAANDSLRGAQAPPQPPIAQDAAVNALDAQNETMKLQNELLKTIAENTKPKEAANTPPGPNDIRAMEAQRKQQ